jgi:class 3 adenylate cyclase
MSDPLSGLVTILFTDLVGSTELLARTGDHRAHPIFRAHHDVLSQAASGHGGHEAKWLGDGLMVAFSSAAGAVRCAIAMQQASRRPVHGEHLTIRVGLNVGEAFMDVSDYFGTAVVIARRLCDHAHGGQILCAETVSRLLSGHAFVFNDLGSLQLKGLTDPVPACEVLYEVNAFPGLPASTPAVGRDTELRRLSTRLTEAIQGRGGVTTIAGEAGIGKTRLLEEVVDEAQSQGALVLTGRCFEGDWVRPYSPFAEALGTHIREVKPNELRADLGPGAAPIAQLVPGLREIFPDVPEPVPLPPQEERFRLIDAVVQFLMSRSRRAPVLLCIDDLQWADKGTVDLLRHTARFAQGQRLLVLGAFRDTDVGRDHPLADALGALPRETDYVAIELRGLTPDAVTSLLSVLSEQDMPPEIGRLWAEETAGNPFFIHELVRHMLEEGKLFRDGEGRWTTTGRFRELGVPKEVRGVIVRRLSRLSENARQLLGVAAAFEGPFPFSVAASVAGLSEEAGLNALDETLTAQLLKPEGGEDGYRFAHALIQQTVYGEFSPSRRLRLHRRLAEFLSRDGAAARDPLRAGEIAAQYHRSRGLPGAEAGAEPALSAATNAEAVAAYDTAARFLRLALELLPEDDLRRPRLLGRLGLALTWALDFDEAVSVAIEASDAIAVAEGAAAATEYLAEATTACAMAWSFPHAFELAPRGLRYADRRDTAWARLLAFDCMRREADDPEHLGIPLDTPERDEAARILRAAQLDPLGWALLEGVFRSRDEALASTNLLVLIYWAGEYRRALEPLQGEAERSLTRGQLARAARCQSFMAFCHGALGELAEARHAIDRAKALVARIGTPVFHDVQAETNLALAYDEGHEELAAVLKPLTLSVHPAIWWAPGQIYADSARLAARLGRQGEALRFLALLIPVIKRAPAWMFGLPVMACHAAETLWLLDRVDHVDTLEQVLLEKVVEPDFRSPMVDGRLALARLCALRGRTEEATGWFDDARRVLGEQGGLPLLSIADFDEARMLLAPGPSHNEDEARKLLDRARLRFRELGMNGWLQRGNTLNSTGG